MSLSSSTTPAVVYPETDDEPMAENSIQYRWIVMIREGLENLFADQPDVYLASDMFWYPVEGDPDIRTAPDVMVVFGRPKGDRPSYMQWEEGGIPPDVVFEILSPSNRPAAMTDKLRFYERYGVAEYYIYDPDEIELKGFIRSGDELRPISNINGWTSPLLNVRFDLSGRELAIVCPDGSPLRPVQEVFKERAALAAKLGASEAEVDAIAAKLDESEAKVDEIAADRDAIAAKLDESETKVDEIAAERDRIARERDELLAALRATGFKRPE